LRSSEPKREQCSRDSIQLFRDLQAKGGRFLGTNSLQPVATAIDGSELDTPIGIAAQIPATRKGTLEFRPVLEIAGLPEKR
jgi:hypothetical protein